MTWGPSMPTSQWTMLARWSRSLASARPTRIRSPSATTWPSISLPVSLYALANPVAAILLPHWRQNLSTMSCTCPLPPLSPTSKSCWLTASIISACLEVTVLSTCRSTRPRQMTSRCICGGAWARMKRSRWRSHSSSSTSRPWGSHHSTDKAETFTSSREVCPSQNTSSRMISMQISKSSL